MKEIQLFEYLEIKQQYVTVIKEHFLNILTTIYHQNETILNRFKNQSILISNFDTYTNFHNVYEIKFNKKDLNILRKDLNENLNEIDIKNRYFLDFSNMFLDFKEAFTGENYNLNLFLSNEKHLYRDFLIKNGIPNEENKIIKKYININKLKTNVKKEHYSISSLLISFLESFKNLNKGVSINIINFYYTIHYMFKLLINNYNKIVNVKDSYFIGEEKSTQDFLNHTRVLNIPVPIIFFEDVRNLDYMVKKNEKNKEEALEEPTINKAYVIYDKQNFPLGVFYSNGYNFLMYFLIKSFAMQHLDEELNFDCFKLALKLTNLQNIEDNIKNLCANYEEDCSLFLKGIKEYMYLFFEAEQDLKRIQKNKTLKKIKKYDEGRKTYIKSFTEENNIKMFFPHKTFKYNQDEHNYARFNEFSLYYYYSYILFNKEVVLNMLLSNIIYYKINKNENQEKNYHFVLLNQILTNVFKAPNQETRTGSASVNDVYSFNKSKDVYKEEHYHTGLSNFDNLFEDINFNQTILEIIKENIKKQKTDVVLENNYVDLITGPVNINESKKSYFKNYVLTNKEKPKRKIINEKPFIKFSFYSCYETPAYCFPEAETRTFICKSLNAKNKNLNVYNAIEYCEKKNVAITDVIHTPPHNLNIHDFFVKEVFYNLESLNDKNKNISISKLKQINVVDKNLGVGFSIFTNISEDSVEKYFSDILKYVNKFSENKSDYISYFDTDSQQMQLTNISYHSSKKRLVNNLDGRPILNFNSIPKFPDTNHIYTIPLYVNKLNIKTATESKFLINYENKMNYKKYEIYLIESDDGVYKAKNECFYIKYKYTDFKKYFKKYVDKPEIKNGDFKKINYEDFIKNNSLAYVGTPESKHKIRIIKNTDGFQKSGEPILSVFMGKMTTLMYSLLPAYFNLYGNVLNKQLHFNPKPSQAKAIYSSFLKPFIGLDYLKEKILLIDTKINNNKQGTFLTLDYSLFTEAKTVSNEFNPFVDNNVVLTKKYAFLRHADMQKAFIFNQYLREHFFYNFVSGENYDVEEENIKCFKNVVLMHCEQADDAEDIIALLDKMMDVVNGHVKYKLIPRNNINNNFTFKLLEEKHEVIDGLLSEPEIKDFHRSTTVEEAFVSNFLEPSFTEILKTIVNTEELSLPVVYQKINYDSEKDEGKKLLISSLPFPKFYIDINKTILKNDIDMDTYLKNANEDLTESYKPYFYTDEY